MRYVQIGDMQTMGEIKKGAPVLYPAIWINLATNKPMPRICFQLQNGQIVPLSSMTLDVAKNAGYTNNYSSDIRPTGSNDFEAERLGVSFQFTNHKLNGISIGSDEVGIGREDEKIFYTPPFTLETLEHIFGHPDSVSDGYFN